MIDLRAKRQQVSAFLLRQGRWYPAGKKTWTKVHMEWLAQQKFEQPERRMAFEEMIFAIRQAQERVARLEQAIRAAVPDWSLAKMVTAFMALRGIDLVSAADLLAELGDLSRFPTAPEVMGYVGMGCSEVRPATQSSVARSPNRVIGERAARWWSAPGATNIRRNRCCQTTEGRGSAAKGARDRLEGTVSLNRRYRALIRRGKRKNVAITAVARELAGFVWAVAREVASAERAAK